MENLLGKVIRDKVSGFTGVCCSKHDLFNGNVQWGIQPYVPDADKLAEANSFDFHQLEICEDQSRANGLVVVDPDPSHLLNIGDEVEDVIRSKLHGIINGRTTFINGCVYYDVVLKDYTIKDTLEPRVFLPFQRLKVIGPGLNKKPFLSRVLPEKSKPAEPVEAEIKPVRRTGGPSQRAPRAC